MGQAASPQMESEEKFTLIDGMITAMFIPKEYDKLLQWRNGKVFRHILVVTILVCLVQYVIPCMGSIAGLGGIEGIVLNEIPQFSLEDGKFYYEDKIEVTDELSGIYLKVDTTVDKFDWEDVPENIGQAFLVSESNMLVYNAVNVYGVMKEEQGFDTMKDITISNQILADSSGLLYIGLGCFFVTLLLSSLVKYLVVALFYAFLIFLMVKFVMQHLEFGTVYKITLFAQTIGILVEAVTYSLGIELLYMAGTFFNVFITVSLTNKVLLKFKIDDMKKDL